MMALTTPCAKAATYKPVFTTQRYAACIRSRRGSTCVRFARTKQSEEVDMGERVSGEFCSIDQQAKRVTSVSMGEMEQQFIAALQAWYYGDKPELTDDEFEKLKEELLWSGSKVAILSADEQRFMEASMGYARGKPVLTDAEFDALKRKLKQQNSFVTAQGPRCSIRSKSMYSDATPDYTRMTLLNAPAAVLVLGALFVVDYSTGFSITRAIELPEPYGIILLWGLLLPTLYILSSSLTNAVLRDGLILQAQCPNCGAVSNAYFGGIFTVPGNKDTSVVECTSCKADIEFNADKREAKVLKTPDEKRSAAEAAAKKKAAAAAKKAAKQQES